MALGLFRRGTEPQRIRQGASPCPAFFWSLVAGLWSLFSPHVGRASANSPISLRQTAEAIVARGEGFELVVSKERGAFDLYLQFPNGEFASVDRRDREMFWFGYNDKEGERRSDENRPRKVRVREARGRVEIEVECPIDPRVGSAHRAVYLVFPEFVLVRSTILRGRAKGRLAIVRVAPRADVDLSLLTHFAVSTLRGGRRVVSGELGKLGRPSYVGVRAWGGPINLSSLDPEAPFLALYNPERRVGLMLVYPFYRRFWSEAQIFLQKWHGGANFLYCGFGDEKFFNKEFLFAFAPVRDFSPEGLRERARRLAREIEGMVSRGEISYPRLERILRAERLFSKLLEEARREASGLIIGVLEGKEPPSKVLRILRRLRFLLALSREAMTKEKVEEAMELLREAKKRVGE